MDRRDRSRERNRRRSRSRDGDRRRGRSRERTRERSSDRKSRDRKRNSRDRRNRSKSRDRHNTRERIRENDDKEIFRTKEERKVQEPPKEEVPRKKKKSNFDVKPVGLEDSMFNDNFSHLQNVDYESALNPIKSLHARRVYVGGVGECNEKDVEKFFNSMIQKAANKTIPIKPVVSVFLNREKHYAFVEFNSIDITTQIMGMNGIMFQGNPLKIRRPNDFNQSMLPPEDPNAPRLDLRKIGLENITDSRDDIYTTKVIFGGITKEFTEISMKGILEPMGKLLNLQVFRNPYTLQSKFFGYAEYSDPVSADLASSELNGLDLGDSKLIVRKATYEAIQSVLKSDIPGELEEFMKIVDGTETIPKQPTRILAVKNIIPTKILGDPDLVEEYKFDFEEECKRYGTVKNVEVPPELTDIIGFGIIYIEFEFIEECRAALIQLYGKKYNERLIICHYFDEIRYIDKDFKD